MTTQKRCTLADIQSADANTLLQVVITAADFCEYHPEPSVLYGDFLKLLDSRDAVPWYVRQYYNAPAEKTQLGTLLPHPALLRDGTVVFLTSKKKT